jgi:hypothetical protein
MAQIIIFITVLYTLRRKQEQARQDQTNPKWHTKWNLATNICQQIRSYSSKQQNKRVLIRDCINQKTCLVGPMASFLVLLGSDKGDVAYFVSLRSSLCILHTSSWVAPSGKFLMGPKVSRDILFLIKYILRICLWRRALFWCSDVGGWFLGLGTFGLWLGRPPMCRVCFPMWLYLDVWTRLNVVNALACACSSKVCCCLCAVTMLLVKRCVVSVFDGLRQWCHVCSFMHSVVSALGLVFIAVLFVCLSEVSHYLQVAFSMWWWLFVHARCCARYVCFLVFSLLTQWAVQLLFWLSNAAVIACLRMVVALTFGLVYHCCCVHEVTTLRVSLVLVFGCAVKYWRVCLFEQGYVLVCGFVFSVVVCVCVCVCVCLHRVVCKLRVGYSMCLCLLFV